MFVDLFGPIKVTECRSQVKRWGVIFTCATGVYVDVVETLETDYFLSCLPVFEVDETGTLTSDQGTNFIGAAREMREAVNNFDHEKIRDSMIKCRMDFQPINGVAHRT